MKAKPMPPIRDPRKITPKNPMIWRIVVIVFLTEVRLVQ